MSSNHWPLYVDLTRDESKRILRRLELEAYGSVVSAFRAQGDLTKKKGDALQNLQKLLSISTERHRAEVRRATNDEELTTIAANISGLDVSSEWQVEGRRLIPLLPRLVPQTAFTLTANSAASVQAEKNACLPSPSKTATAPAAGPCPTPPSAGIGAAGPKLARAASPNSNVVVLPSGMSIHIKGLTEEEDSPVLKKRRRSSSSSESSILVSKAHPVVSNMTSSKVMASGMVSSGGSTSTPMKITFSKSPVKSQTTITPSQKVILVSSSQSATGANILQRSLNVPVVKATSSVTLATGSSSLGNKPSIIVSTTTATTPTTTNLGNIITVASSASGNTTTGTTYVGGQNYVASTFRPRTKTITTMRHRAPNTMGRGSRIIPVGGSGGPVHPSPHQGMQNIHIKPVVKPTIHIKQEGGMKIITQGVPQSANKILPKPSGGGSSPVVVMTTVSSPGITMVTKSAQGSPMGSRVLNITTQGGKVIATTSRSTSGNVVTVNPKTLQLTAIKGATGAKVLASSGRVATATGTKPNVIVVQKAQPRGRGMGGTPTVIKASTSSNNAFEKELVSFIQQRQDPGKQLASKLTDRKLIAPKPSLETLRKTGVIRQRSEPGEGNKSSLLAELIQAVGIIPQEGGAGGEHVHMVQEAASADGSAQPGTSKGGHRWVEYDAPAPRTSLQTRTITTTRENSTAIKALLDLRPSVATKVKGLTANRSTPIEYGEQEIQQSEVYTIDSLGNLIPQSDKLVTSSDELQFIQGNKPVGEEVLVSVEGGSDFAQQVTSLGGEILGELDPQTGIFYNTSSSHGTEVVTSVAGVDSSQQVVISAPKTPRTQTVVVTSSGRQIDFLTSALSQANIDLDSYHFIEEDVGSSHMAQIATQGSKEVIIKTSKIQEKTSGMPMMSLLTQQTVPAMERIEASVSLTHEQTPLLTETVVLEDNVIEMPIDEPFKQEELIIQQEQEDIQQLQVDQQQLQTEPQQFEVQQQPFEQIQTDIQTEIQTETQPAVNLNQNVNLDVDQTPSLDTLTEEVIQDVETEPDFVVSMLSEQTALESQQPTEELQTPAEELQPPTMNSQQLTLESQKPAVESQQPTVVSQQPTVELPQAAVEAQQPTVDSQQPAAECHRPAVTSQQTAVTSQKPVLTSQQQAVTLQQSAVELQRLAVESQQPAVESQQPAVESQQPAVESQQPAAKPQQPAVATEPALVSVNAQPTPNHSTLQNVTELSVSQLEQPLTSPQVTADDVKAEEQPKIEQPTLVEEQPPSQESKPSVLTKQSMESLTPNEELSVEPVIGSSFAQEVVTTDSELMQKDAVDTPDVPVQSRGLPEGMASMSSMSNASLIPPVTDDLIEISSTQDLTGTTVSSASSSATPIFEQLNVSRLPLAVRELPQGQASSRSLPDGASETSGSPNQPDTSSTNTRVAVKVVTERHTPVFLHMSSEAATMSGEASTEATSSHSSEHESETTVISSTQDDDSPQNDPTGNVFVMETGLMQKPTGNMMQHPIHEEGSGVTVAYQPHQEIVSYTSQVEQIDSSGDHEMYDYDESLGSPSAGGSSDYLDDPSTPLRNSKRKRKPPRAADESPPPTPQLGWSKIAINLVLKISRFRGIKEKGEPNASIWFLEPVSAIDVPDYYDIIKKPMDFSKIKRKLENGEYRRWDDFNADMMLIRENCYVYNTPGSVVRADCDQVFTFYASEYGKAVEKWQRSQVGSPAKKIRPEKHQGHL